MVFQDPYGSLNSMRTIRQTLVEPLIAHRRAGAASARTQVEAALHSVGLDPEAPPTATPASSPAASASASRSPGR